MTLIDVDLAQRIDRLHLAFVSTELAGMTAFAAPFQPFKKAVAPDNRETRTQWTKVLTVEFAIKRGRYKQPRSVNDEGPASHEMKVDGCFEWLHLGVALGQVYGLQRQSEENQEDDVFYSPQPLVREGRKPQLVHMQAFCRLADQGLQGTKGAKPSAIHAATDEEHRYRNKDPQNKNEGIDQEGRPAEAVENCLGESEDIDDRELCEAVPADENDSV